MLTNAPSSFLGVRVSSERNARIALADASTARARVVCLRGQLAASQGDCQTLRADNGDSYSLVGNLEGLKVGDRVYAAGTIADESFCGTNRTVVLTWIRNPPSSNTTLTTNPVTQVPTFTDRRRQYNVGVSKLRDSCSSRALDTSFTCLFYYYYI